MATAAILLFFLVGVISLLGIVYPFRPFRTRKRALRSFGACFAGFIIAAIAAPTPNSTAQSPSTSADVSATPASTVVSSSEPEPTAEAATTKSTPAAGAPIDGTPKPVDRPMPRQTAAATTGTTEDGPIRTGTTKLTPKAPAVGGRKEIVAEDIYWDDDSRPFQTELLAAANRIQSENAECGKVEDIVKSPSRSKPGDPIFFVACAGTKGIPFNVWFRPKDAENAASFAAIRPIGQGEALVACQQAARNAANNPHSVDFSIFLDVAYQEFANGRALLSSTFTARNAFNAESEYEIRCYFDGATMSEVEIAEAR